MAILDQTSEATKTTRDRRIQKNGFPKIQGLGRGEIHPGNLAVDRIRMAGNFRAKAASPKPIDKHQPTKQNQLRKMNDQIYAMPHNPRAEKSLVSFLAAFPENVDEFPDLCEDHFFGITTREIFRRVKSGCNTDFILDHLAQEQSLDKFGGVSAIVECLNANPGMTIDNARDHYQELCLYMARRKAVEAAEKLKEVALTEHSTEALEQAAGNPITRLLDQLHGRSKERTKKQILEDCYLRLKRRIDGDEPLGIQTTIEPFNRLFGGLMRGHTIVISAKPGGGKSMLALQMVLDAAKQNQKSLILSLEMGDCDLMDRATSYIGGIPLDQIVMAKKEVMTKDFMSRYARSCKAIVNMPFEIMQCAGWHHGKLISKIRKEHRQSPLGVVMIDYMQIVRAHPDMARDSREQQLAVASNELAALAKELGITMILLSQLNKVGDAKHAEAINEAADLHLSIRQIKSEDEPTQWIGVRCAKSRNTPHEGKTMPIRPDDGSCRFVEMTDEEIEDVRKKFKSNQQSR